MSKHVQRGNFINLNRKGRKAENELSYSKSYKNNNNKKKKIIEGKIRKRKIQVEINI